MRVVVGVDGSMAGLRALRVAVAEARRRGAELHAVRVWTLGVGGTGTPCIQPDLAALARDTIHAAFNAAMGIHPTDVHVVLVVLQGDCSAALVSYANRDDDLLVVGRSPRRLHRRLLGSVARYCVAQASCPVLVVPPDELARQERRLVRRMLREADAAAKAGRPAPPG